MGKCNCRNFKTAASCPIHTSRSASYKFLKGQYKAFGVDWLADEVIRLKRKIRKLEKPKSVPRGKVSGDKIDKALSNPKFRSISHSDAFIISLIMGVSPKRRAEAYKRLKNKMGDVGHYIAKEQSWI